MIQDDNAVSCRAVVRVNPNFTAVRLEQKTPFLIKYHNEAERE